MALFAASEYKKRITDITAEELSAWGIRGLLLDVDNTLTTHDNPKLAEDVRAWLDARASEAVRMTVVSNHKARRVAPFAARLTVDREYELFFHCIPPRISLLAL